MPDYNDLYGELTGSLTGSRGQISDKRDEAVDWLDSFYPHPGQANTLSSNLDSLLDYNSQYIKDARANSRDASEKAGMLESGFTEGMGEVSAIDNAFDMAYSETMTGAFNVYQENELDLQEYNQAAVFNNQSVEAAGNQTLDEFGYVLESTRREEELEDTKELMDLGKVNLEELMKTQQDYLVDRQTKMHDNSLATMDYGYGLASKYLDLNQAYTEVNTANQFRYDSSLQAVKHADDIDMLYMRSSNELANRILRDKSGLQKHYLNGYAGIMLSDLHPEDKYDLLVGLGNSIQSATDDVVSNQFLKIEDNPYGISFIDNLTPYNVGDREDSQFVWDIDDAIHEYKDLDRLSGNIMDNIHGETTHQERDMIPLWSTITDDLLPELSRLNLPNASPEDKQAFTDKMEFYKVNKSKYVSSDSTTEELDEFFTDMFYIGKVRDDFGRLQNSFEIIPPRQGIDHIWESDSRELLKVPVMQKGNQMYYDDLYARYDAALADGINYLDVPDGYKEAKAACIYPSMWRNGKCVSTY